MNRTRHPRPSFHRTGIAAALFALTLTGCLSGGGGGGSDPVVTPPTTPPSETPTVQLTATTQQGDVKGIQLDGMRVFRGIPFAAPPERFNAPKPALNRNTTLVLSDEFAADCAQPGGTFGSGSTAEDCLFLNVYAPQEPGDYPVMVWIHGGAFVTGSGGDAYEPSRLVEQGVVVVTINYRLGALGFLPHASLADADGNFGNYGLMDQQEALRWVEKNIASFDGDPDNVTIFGESAGGHSVMSHVVAPDSATLFDKAISQSGGYNPTQLPQALGNTLFGAPFVNATGCADAADIAACLRALPVAEVISNQVSNYIPVVNNASGTLPRSIDTGLATEEFNKVPMILGSNQDEGRLFVGLEELTPANRTDATNYVDKVKALLATDPRPFSREAVAAAYLLRIENDTTINATAAQRYPLALAAIQTDWRFACSGLNQLNQVDSAAVPTWGYWFTDRNAPNIIGVPTTIPWGAAHAFEIQYVLSDALPSSATAAQTDLSNNMVEYWTNLAKFGDPNSTDGAAQAVTWNQFNGGAAIMDLDPTAQAGQSALGFFNYHNCGFWADPVAAQAN